jgi:hypothetical protein
MSVPPTTEQPVPSEIPQLQLLSQKAAAVGRKVTTRHGWVGDYDYAWLCTPSIPFFRKRHVSPPFYGLDSEIPLLVAITCGLQHALAMLAGLITPPIIFASSLSLDPETSAYMISASLIGCGKDTSPHPTRDLTRHDQEYSVSCKCRGFGYGETITWGPGC